jgi:alpha-D-xyloside xylohydrolase
LWGEKKFDKKRFPDLPATVRKLHEDHVHFMVSIWPNMSTDS